MIRLAAAITGIALLGATTAFAGAAKTYQVTGPVLEVKDDMVVVQKERGAGSGLEKSLS